MLQKILGKGLKWNDAAGDDLHGFGAIQAGRQDRRQILTEKRLSAFQADEFDPTLPGEGGHDMSPLFGGELLLRLFLGAAVSATEGTTRSQGYIQYQRLTTQYPWPAKDPGQF